MAFFSHNEIRHRICCCWKMTFACFSWPAWTRKLLSPNALVMSAGHFPKEK